MLLCWNNLLMVLLLSPNFIMKMVSNVVISGRLLKPSFVWSFWHQYSQWKINNDGRTMSLTDLILQWSIPRNNSIWIWCCKSFNEITMRNMSSEMATLSSGMLVYWVLGKPFLMGHEDCLHGTLNGRCCDLQCFLHTYRTLKLKKYMEEKSFARFFCLKFSSF